MAALPLAHDRDDHHEAGQVRGKREREEGRYVGRGQVRGKRTGTWEEGRYVGIGQARWMRAGVYNIALFSLPLLLIIMCLSG